MENYSEEHFLKPEIMLRLYAEGAFPMTNDEGVIDWYYPEIRTIIPLNNFNIPRSLTKSIAKLNFQYRVDSDFPAVVTNCANRSKTWISKKLINAYMNLWEQGFIHTVEVYQDNILVGGLYGVSVRGAFFGESMFSKVTQASKAALVFLLNHLNRRKFVLLDVQFMTEHLKMFGAVEISLPDYNELLKKAYRKNYYFNDDKIGDILIN
jgi:leucyl/phenylalanyl-tRNA---protein transferase